ncbi:MAG: 50S ribosomal protein L10 [Pseudomonadota bacterium]|nr:50S ribosomal protein L10 [Pseudomonadota bacterium]
MPLALESKKALVAEVSQVVAGAHSAIAAEYRGLTVAEMDELRKKARNEGVYLRVVKNTLARRALVGSDFESLGERLVGPLVLGFSLEDPGAAARLFKDFGKSHDALKVKALALGGQVLEASDIDRVANLPTRDQAISTLMAVMKAPVEKFVRTLNEPTAKMVRTFGAVRDQKQAA